MNAILQYPSSVLFYLSILVISVLIAKKADKSDNFAYVLVLILGLSFIAGLRNDSVGIDTAKYMMSFRNNQYYLYEIGFETLTSIFDFINNEQLYLFSIGFIIYFLTLFRLWELRKVIDFRFAVFFFIAYYYASSFNTMRQAIAISIIFFGSRYLYIKKPWKFLGMVFLASLFHQSAIIAVVFVGIYLLSIRKITRTQALSFLLFLFVMPIMGAFIITNPIILNYIVGKFDYYFTNQFNPSNGGVGVFVFLYLFAIIVSRLIVRLKDTRFNSYIFNTAFIYTIFGTLISIIGYYFTYMNRIGHYFTVMELIYIPFVWKESRRLEKTTRIMIRVVFLGIIFYPYILQIVNNSYGTFPYILFNF